MIAPGSGGIITVTSNGGVIGEPFLDAYCASKFALEGLMQSLAPIAAHFGGKEHHGLPDLSRGPEPPDRSSDGVSTAPGFTMFTRMPDPSSSRIQVRTICRSAAFDPPYRLMPYSEREIAKRAGVGPGTLYRHFPTREDLLDACMKNRTETIQAAAAKAVASDPPPRRVLVESLEAFLAHIRLYRGGPSRLIASMRDPASAIYPKLKILASANDTVLQKLRADGALRRPFESVSASRSSSPCIYLGPAMSSRIWANRSGWRSGRACPASGTLTLRTLTWAQTARMAS